MSDVTETVAGLRALADWYEEHSDIRAPKRIEANLYDYNNEEDAAAMACAMGNFDKHFDIDGLLVLEKGFGSNVMLRAVYGCEMT